MLTVHCADVWKKFVRYPASITYRCYTYNHIQNIVFRILAEISDIGIFLLPNISIGIGHKYPVSVGPECVFTSCSFTHSVDVLCVGQKACRDVEESERLLETLQAEVSALRRKLREKQQNRAAKGRWCSSCYSRSLRPDLILAFIMLFYDTRVVLSWF